MNGYTKEQAIELITKTDEMIERPLLLVGYFAIEESIETANWFKEPKAYPDTHALYTAFRRIKPTGRFSVIVNGGEDLSDKKAAVHIFDSQVLDKAFTEKFNSSEF
jgi:hypothetical protein